MEPWNFQACTQLPMQPLTSNFLGFYPPETLGEMEQLKKNCWSRFRVFTRPDQVPLTYGGFSHARTNPLGVATGRTTASDAPISNLDQKSGDPHLVAKKRESVDGNEIQEFCAQSSSRIPLTNAIVVDGELDQWRVGSFGGGALVDDNPKNSTASASVPVTPVIHCVDSNVVKILPVKGAAHHQDLIAESSADSPELIAARKLILDTLRHWAEKFYQVRNKNNSKNENIMLTKKGWMRILNSDPEHRETLMNHKNEEILEQQEEGGTSLPRRTTFYDATLLYKEEKSDEVGDVDPVFV